MKRQLTAAVCIALAALSSQAVADINVGISLNLTGPGSALGVPQEKAIPMLPKTIAGERVNYIVLNDGTNPTEAAKNATQFVSKWNVDVILGSSTVPGSLAIAEVALRTKTPQVSMTSADVNDERHKWLFLSGQRDRLMLDAIGQHMAESGYRSVAFLGYADSFGEGWLREMPEVAGNAGVNIVATERFNRTDTNVTGQALKIVAARPDAVVVVASGTVAALPHRTLVELGYNGTIYHTHAAASSDFLRVGGDAIEGAILPVGPVLVAEQLPDEHPSKQPGMEFQTQYEKLAGTRSPFAAYLFDAMKIVEAAVPAALADAKPGTLKFREALRDQMEAVQGLAGTHGVYNMSPDDHFGHDSHGRVLVRVEQGKFKYLRD